MEILDKRKSNIISQISCRLLAEGVSGENYDREVAIAALSDCITPTRLQGWLLDYEGLIIDYLNLLSQNKQQMATESFETLPDIKQQFTANEQLILFTI